METGDANCDPDDDGPSVVVVPPSADNCEAPESSKEGDNDAAGDRSAGDAVAKGISSVLVSVIKDFDSRAQDTLKSQDQLSSSIDRLTSELDRLLEDAPLPFIMQHAARISSVRKRVSSMNAVLKSIQRRVDNIDRMLSTASAPEKTNGV
ncbi:Biogenesis of lysosome-related organelles complex 1 subunit 7 [Psidium guajava]|nr:Biogenesis of lysosome-related organelles complex 1 subunit 7 [Psidium guajava]